MLSPLFSPAGGGSSGSSGSRDGGQSSPYADPTDHRVPNDAPAGIPTNVPNDAANDAANGAPSTKKQRRGHRQHWGAITYDGPYTTRRPLHYTTPPMTPPTTLSTCAPVLPTCARRSHHHCSFRHPVPTLLRLFRRLPLRLLSLRLLSLLLLPAIPVDASPRCPAGAPTFACTMYPDSADIRACSTSVIEHCIWRQRTMHVHSPLIPATVVADALCTAHHACIMHYM